jgi:hypothetical protein
LNIKTFEFRICSGFRASDFEFDKFEHLEKGPSFETPST